MPLINEQKPSSTRVLLGGDIEALNADLLLIRLVVPTFNRFQRPSEAVLSMNKNESHFRHQSSHWTAERLPDNACLQFRISIRKVETYLHMQCNIIYCCFACLINRTSLDYC